LVFLVFQENAAVQLPTATGMTTWSSFGTQFWSVFVYLWEEEARLTAGPVKKKKVSSANNNAVCCAWVCVSSQLFLPLQRRRCDVQCLVMLTDTAFLDDAQ
jgi:hypothetical protein